MSAAKVMLLFRSIACSAAFMYPSAYAMPACHGASQVICGVWSGMSTPSKPLSLKDSQHAQHVDVAVVDERLAIVRHLARDVAEVNVRQLALPAVVVVASYTSPSVISASVPMQNSSALAGLGLQIEQSLVQVRLVDEPRLAAHRRHRRIVGVGRERDAGLLGHRHELVKKLASRCQSSLVRYAAA